MVSNFFKRFENNSIAICPFKRSNIEKANLCVTASEFAWLIGGEGDYLVTKENDEDKGRIRIPANKSVIIFTQEALYLGDKLSGDCLPRMDLLIRGLWYNGPPLKPGRAEILKIFLNNQTDEDIFIDVGERIAVLRFYELDKQQEKQQEKQEEDHNIVIDKLLNKCKNPKSIKSVLVERLGHITEKYIINKMKEDLVYKEYIKSMNTLPERIKRNKVLSLVSILLVVLLVLLGFKSYIIINENLLTSLIPIVGSLFVILLSRKFKWE